MYKRQVLQSAIGGADCIVGITHECDYPDAVISRNPPVVTTSDISPYTMSQEEIHEAVCGSLKNGHSLYGLKKETLLQVQPDIIFTQQLCDVCAVSYPVVLETCAKIVAGGEEISSSTQDKAIFDPKIISLEPSNLKDVFVTAQVAAKAMGPSFVEPAEACIQKWQSDLGRIQQVVENWKHTSKNTTKPRVAFFEWHSPIFVGGHWIADMMRVAGAQYDMCASGKRSFAITDEELSELDPDYVLIGPCGFSLQQSIKDTQNLLYGVDNENLNPDAEKREKQRLRTAWWRSLRAVQNGNVYCLDGNSYYARPGPRLVQGAGIIAACIHGADVAQALGEDLAPSSGYCKMNGPP